MSGGARRGPNEILSFKESPVVTVSTEIILSSLDSVKPHCFLGVKFFSDAGGTTPAVPGAGTVTITIQTINSEPLFELPPDNLIDLTNQTTISWASNTKAVKAVPSGVTVATHYKVVVTCNET